MEDLAGQRCVEGVRTPKPWSSSDPSRRTHVARMYSLGLAARWFQPPARFVIVTPGRSGSELLTDLLNSHPDIVCETEILRQRMVLPERFVAGRSTKAGLDGARAYGFKINCAHFGYQVLRERRSFLSTLSTGGVQLIFLRRENHLAQAISSTVAARTRCNRRSGDRPAFARLELDPVEVLMMTYLFEESDQYLGALLQGLPHLTLTYERDLFDREAQDNTVERICARLAVRNTPTASDQVRFTPQRLSETVANIDAVDQLLRPTRFCRFLDDEPEEPMVTEPVVTVGPVEGPLCPVNPVGPVAGLHHHPGDAAKVGDG